MLDFPSSPQVDDLFPDPPVEDARQWRWDGERWRTVGGEGGDGGGGGGPAMGVIDGSDAQPGEVGEYMTAGGTSVSVPSSQTPPGVALASLTLTPGDWEVGGSFQVTAGSGNTVTRIGMSWSVNGGLVPANSWFNVTDMFTSGLNIYLPMPTFRVSSASSSLLQLMGTAGFDPPTVTGFGVGSVWARRMR